MFFNDDELDEYIEQIKKELDEFQKTRDIILNYFKSKSLNESIAIINNKYYLDIIDNLKQKQLYNDISDYNHKIDTILFDYFTKQENAIRIQTLDVIPDELNELDFSDVYIIQEDNQLYLLTSELGQGYKTYSFQKFEIKSKEMQLTYDFSKEYKQLKEKYKNQMKEWHKMNQNLNEETQENPIFKNYIKLLESANFEIDKIEHDSNNIQISATYKQQRPIDYIELYLNINYETQIVNEITLNQLSWREKLSLTLPGQNVQLEITGYNDDFIDSETELTLNIKKTETNVKVTDLVITIKSMLQEIKNAEASLN